MSHIVMSIVGLLPTRSAYSPKKMPPNGLAKKPTPKTATDSSRLLDGDEAGKKVCPMKTAKNA